MTGETNVANAAADEGPSKKGYCCSTFDFQGVKAAKAWCFCAIARGAFLLSFLWLTNSFVYLASEDAGCEKDEKGRIISGCAKKVYGFRPDSIYTIVTTLSGVLSALFMPVIGAMIDYSPFRRTVGFGSAIIITLIQAACAFTVSSTWLLMLLLTGLNGFLNEVQFCSYSAYLPEIQRTVGETVMTKFVTVFFVLQMCSEILYMATVTVISVYIKNTVKLAHISQAVNAVWVGLFFYIGWKMMPAVPPKHTNTGGRNLLIVGFEQNWNTCKMVAKHYKKGLRFFFLSALMGDNALTNAPSIAISFFTIALKMSPTTIGAYILAVLFFTIPGATLGSAITKRTNPVTSLKLALTLFFVTTLSAGLVLTDESYQSIALIWAVCWGLSIGWFFPTENLLFSILAPPNYETEMSGFFAYSTQILGWAPPLLYTYMNERGYGAGLGLITLNIWVILGIIPLFLYADWDEVLAESKKDIIEESKETKKDEVVESA